jgi:hypothetical protein
MGKQNYNLKDDNDDPYSDLLEESSNDTLKAPEQETRAQRKWKKLSKLS